MASWGLMGGKGTPRLGGRPGLELRSENKSFFIRQHGRVSCQSAHRRRDGKLQYHKERRLSEHSRAYINIPFC